MSGKHRFYLNLLGTCEISRNEKYYQGTSFHAYTAYMMAYIKSIFLDRGNGRDVHFLAVAIYDDGRQPFDSPEAFTRTVSKGVPVCPPHMHHRRTMMSALRLSVLLNVPVNFPDPVTRLFTYGVDRNFPGCVFDSPLPPER